MVSTERLLPHVALSAHAHNRMGLRRTYQASLLFRNLSVRDNVFLAVRGVSRRRYSPFRVREPHPSRRAARELLDYVRLSSVADLPVSELSHGQQRQLEIGMALAGAPRLILFDEPAAGLSSGESQEMTGFLKRLDPELAILLIEHDMDVVFDFAEHITVLHFGQVVEEGVTESIRGSRKVEEVYLGTG